LISPKLWFPITKVVYSDVYKNIVFKTKGFSLKAPEVPVEEKDNEVKIIILSKVARAKTK